MAHRMYEEQPALPEREREEARELEVAAGGSAASALLGIGAIVLCIIGLAGVLTVNMAAIAAIVIGLAQVGESAAVASRYRRALDVIRADRRTYAGLSGGMSAEFIGGLAAIVLGILTIIGFDPLLLLPAAVIVSGAALFLAAGTAAGVNATLMLAIGVPERERHMMIEGMALGSGGKALAGLATIAIGIVALVAALHAGDLLANINLTLVGLLSLGAAIALSGTALAGRVFRTSRQETVRREKIE